MLHALLLATALSAQRPADVHASEARAASALLRTLNAERRREGDAPLALDPQLGAAALEHVADMARRQYFEHTSPSGVTPFERMRRYGCEFTYAAENIALAGDAAQADSALFKSAPHRMNTLNPRFTRVGIAVTYAADGRMLFVEDFAG
ncbi:MAG TPA: CAP domain-containing protein [Candidatus Baltobacteraceae bacterium]|nr:CAP domain-containing protein [Candidatus Baltobacteraceae bacterium]